jgi:type II secretory pathway component GspD/PulD (secretin)
MLRLKNKNLVRRGTVAIAALIITGFALAACGEDTNEIDLSKISQSNPFAQVILAQAQAQTKAQTPQVQVKTDEPKPELFVESVTLKFLDAKSLKASISNMSGNYGSMEPDAKGNSLIICDTNENVGKIISKIRAIDKKPDQIMIEVVIVDVKLDNETQIGIDWDMLTTRDHDAVFRQNLDFTSRLKSTEQTTANVGTATAFNTTGTGSDLLLLWPGDIRTVIHALQEKNNVEIIASPRVMVVSGQTASIEAVEEVPYSETSNTSQGGELTSTQFKNVGVKLNVGATLTDDKFILLNVETEQNVQTGTSVVSGVVGAPIIDTRKIQSSLLLNDSQILVIGGLRRKTTQKQTNQFPILGDLPIVGYAFKTTDTIENSSELLVILSPHIYKGERPTDTQMEKYNEITQRPLLTLPKPDPNGIEERIGKGVENLLKPSADGEKEKERKAKEAEKLEKAKKIKEAKKAEEMNKKTKVVKNQKSK